MKLKSQLSKAVGAARHAFVGARHGAMAGAAGAALLAGNLGRAARSRATQLGDEAIKKYQKKKGVVEMKKSTLITLFVVLAAVAGALGALYMYVLRRERELDEYEQLLFSEDFGDEYDDDLDMAEAAEAPADAEPAKA